MKRLNRKQSFDLVDALRRSLLYQTPKVDPETGNVTVKIHRAHYGRIMRLIAEAGGWTLPPDAQAQIKTEHENKIANLKRQIETGEPPDFSQWTDGDFAMALTELARVADVPEVHALAEAVLAETKRRGLSPAQGTAEAFK